VRSATAAASEYMSQVSTHVAGWSSALKCAQNPTSDQAHETAPVASTKATARGAAARAPVRVMPELFTAAIRA
jgi:hypothetical protein